MTLSISNPRARPRWLLLLATVVVMVLALAASSLAVHDASRFELDKDASNDVRTTPSGYLASNITNTATAINVCQILTYTLATGVTANYPAPAVNDTILIEAERMTVTANNTGNFGGNCAGTKQTYTVIRAAGGTTATAHAGGAQKIEAGVSLFTTHTSAELAAGPDWDQVYAAWDADNDTKCTALGLVECTFVEDGIGPSIFTIGSTKDHLPLSGWRHTSGASPDKGEIINAYAAKGIAADGDQLIYFGMDRYAVDGSTDIGFWFFQNEVSVNPDGTFTGDHAEGDVLILGTFTQGGAASNIRVFNWVGDPETGTAVGPTGAFGDCAAAGIGDEGCATVNNASISVPWTYTFKGSAKSGWVPAGGFFEGGLNLTEAGLDGCFSTFLAETRSSPELSAILKDFALGDFEACDTGLITTPSDAQGAALPLNSETELREAQLGTGAAGVGVTDSALLDVTGTDTWSGTLDFYLCGPFAAGSTCDADGVLISSDAISSADGTDTYTSGVANLTEAGYYCWRGEFTSSTDGVPDAADASEGECFVVLPVQPTITTNATAAVAIDGSIDDTATLSGTAYQPGTDGAGDANGDYTSINATMDTPANGTITFVAYGPHADDETCTTVAYESEVVVAGDDDYVASDGDGGAFTPSDTGFYNWIASYSGDDPNTLNVSGLCGEEDETSEVVDAYIELDPLEATNEVNDEHVITATVTQITGAGESAAPENTLVEFSLLNNTAGATFLLDGEENPIDSCLTVGTTGQCSVTIVSSTAGSVDIHAQTEFDVSGVTLFRETDGDGNNSDDANKIFVDASIEIDPLQDVNNINSEHVFTITVTIYPAGADVTDLTIIPSLDPAADEEADTCATPDVDGDTRTCTVTINHGSAETFTLNASVTMTIEGETITRDTDPATADVGAGPGGTGPATKEFVEGTLTWLKVDQDGHLLAGATFEVCQTEYLDTSSDPHELVALVDECFEVVDFVGPDPDYAGLDADPVGGQFLLEGLSLGTWTIRETAAPEGYAFDDEFTQTVELTLENPDGSAEDAFLNERLLKLVIFTCNESTGELVISQVSLELDGTPVVKDTFGAVPAGWTVSEADLCAVTDGAVYGGLDAGTYVPSVLLPKPLPPGL